MDSVFDKIEALSREETLEAVLALKQTFEDEGDETGENGTDFLAAVKTNPYGSIGDVEELSKFVLAAAALDPRFQSTVEQVVDGVGQKAFIFGGTEILVAASLGVLALHIVLSKGKSEETEETTLEWEDGLPVIKTKKVTRWGVPSPLTGLISILAGRTS